MSNGKQVLNYIIHIRKVVTKKCPKGLKNCEEITKIILLYLRMSDLIVIT
jgi:hypothetical protein